MKRIFVLSIEIIAVILLFGLIIYLMFGDIFLKDQKIEQLSKNHKSHTSKVIAYNFQGPEGSDSIKLKDGTQFDINHLNIDDSNFESKIKFSSSTVKLGKKVTYIKTKEKDILSEPYTYYYILDMK